MNRLRFEVPPGGTPLEKTKGLRIRSVRTYEELSSVEAENIAQAMTRQLRPHRVPTSQWFTESFLRKLHREMFFRVWVWAGKYRTTKLNLGVPSHSIREEVGKLIKDLQFWETPQAKMAVVERAARIHHRLVWVHPFVNGNGRHARLVGDIYLMSQRHSIPLWQKEDLSKEGMVRQSYLQAIKKADAGEFEPLVNFTNMFIPRRS